MASMAIRPPSHAEIFELLRAIVLPVTAFRLADPAFTDFHRLKHGDGWAAKLFQRMRSCAPTA
jgi:hypothetical protein